MFRSIATGAIALTLVGCSGDGGSTSGVEEVVETTKKTTTTPPVEKKAQEKTPDPVVEEEPEIVLIPSVAVPLPAEVGHTIQIRPTLDGTCQIDIGIGSANDGNYSLIATLINPGDEFLPWRGAPPGSGIRILYTRVPTEQKFIYRLYSSSATGDPPLPISPNPGPDMRDPVDGSSFELVVDQDLEISVTCITGTEPY